MTRTGPIPAAMNIAAPAQVSPVSGRIVQAGALLADPRADRLFIDVHLGTDPQEEIDSFREAHVHGAVYAQTREVFAGPETPESGSLPLPGVATLQAAIDDWHIGEETEIIVYGPSPALAARGWWVLTWAGLKHVRLLDGGLDAWARAGGPVAQGDAPPLPARRSAPVKLSPGHLPAVEIDGIDRLGPDAILIDARDEAAFRAGCIPGAVNLPAADQWTPGRLIRTGAEIAGLYRRAGVRADSDVVVYCGGGVLSALSFITLDTISARPRLFVGSWSEWSKNPARMAASAPYLAALARAESNRNAGGKP